jgi:hypothetical protein
MKINVVTKNTIINYASHNAQSKGPLNIWLEGMKIADWERDQKGLFCDVSTIDNI